MNNIHLLARRTASAIHRMVTPPLLTGQAAQDYIIGLIESEKPCMVARFGSVEIQAVVNGILPPPVNQILRKRTYNFLLNNAGFFPVNRDNVKRFSAMMREDMAQLDALGSWRIEENLFRGRLKQATMIKLSEFAPAPSNRYFSHLKGKKVLVVSPFSSLISEQYHYNRVNIWPGSELLPEYQKLETVTSVNSIGGKCDYSSWFEALEAMKKEIETKDFEVALLGCGAYGFPLAAHVKRMGKKAIHVGGSLQLLFGIYGKRWEHQPYINENWVRPRAQDRPQGFEKVENGCYW